MSYKVFVGDCIESMRAMPEKSVHTCVTSPPYFGLRDYGQDGQIGLEPTPDEFVAALVAVFREVRRVLRDDGTVWLNLGDSYASSGVAGALGKPNLSRHGDAAVNPKNANCSYGRAPTPEGLKTKDLIGIPWRVAFALQADGWYLYDHEAAKEPAVGGATGAAATFKRDASKRAQTIPGQGYGTHLANREAVEYNGEKRNRRSVWTVSTRPYKGAHFATFPPDLIQPCILAGCPEGGTVLDPFGGSGTTAGVALAHDRNATLCELNPDYAALIPDRIQWVMDYYGFDPYREEQVEMFGGVA